MKYAYILVLAILCVTTGAYADVVNKISIESMTNQNVPEDVVRANIVLQEGATFSQRRLSEDIKRLIKTGQFADVATEVNPVGGGAVDIVFRLKPKKRIAQINFKGNSKVSTRDLQDILGVQVGDPMSGGKLGEDLRAITEYYHGKGFHDIVVDQKVKDIPGTNDVMVEYAVKEKVRYKTRRLKIQGNTVYRTGKIKRIMDTGVSIWGHVFPTGYYNEEIFKQDLDKLEAAYWEKGYLNFKVEKVDKAVDDKRGVVLLTLILSEGEIFKVGTVNLTGNQVVSEEELSGLIRIAPEQIYSKAVERGDIRRLGGKYNGIGHLDNRVYADRNIDKIGNTVDIVYQIREGSASKVRDINITGNRITKDHVIRRELQLHPGDLTDGNKIDSTRARLQNLGYFETVDINARSTEDPDAKDLEIKVKEQVTGRLSFGAGISSADSVVALIEISQTNFDLRDPPSFRGGGQRLQFRAQAGSEKQNFNIAFTEPWLFHKPLRLDYNIWKRDTSRNINWDQGSTGTSIRLTRKMATPFWRQYAGYRIAEMDVADIDSDFSPEFVLAEEGTEISSTLLFGFSRDHRDRAILTSSGSKFSISSELQLEGIGSYSNIYKVDVEADKWWPVLKESVVRLSGRAAYVNAFNGDDARIWDRYFTGGSNSIRGFEERDVGPVDSGSDEPIGGNALVTSTVEFTTPVYEKTVYWALFADAGNVYDHGFSDIGDFNVGAGTGVRLMLPIGGIRIDYGWPVVQDQEHLSSGGKLHFDFGFNF